MIDRTSARLSSRFLSFGLPFLYFLTSVAFYLHTYDSAQVKITIVQMLGTSLIGFWYVNLVSDWKFDWKKYAPLAVPLLMALASGLLSWAHAAYPGPSLDEALRRVFYVHFALIALKEINTLERLKRMVKYLLAAVIVAAVYGLMQSLDARFFQITTNASGIDPFVWRQAFGSRIFSTFGNPNFFGNFLVILTPVTLALMLRRYREHAASMLVFVLSAILVSVFLWQIHDMFDGTSLESWETPLYTMVLLAFLFWSVVRYSLLGALFFLITYCNFVTGSKGAWVGFAASFVSFMVLVLVYFSQFRSEKIRRVILTAAWSILLLIGLVVGIYSHGRPNSLRFRWVTWTSTWEMAQLNPFWGNGIGTFRVIYPAFRRPQIFHIEGKHNTETDHAEDEYLEVLQDEGIVGFGIFIWLIVTYSVVGVRALRRFTEGFTIRDVQTGKRKTSDDPRAYYMLGFLAAFWGMLMHNFMDVSLRFVSSGIFLWLLMGLIGAMVLHDPMPDTDEQWDARQPSDAAPPAGPGISCLVASAITAVLYALLSWKVLREFNDAQGPTPGPFGEVLLWLIAWIAFLTTVCLVLYGVYRLSRSIRLIQTYLVLWAVLYPLNVFWGYFMADVYHNRGIFFSKQGQWETALKNYQNVIALNPNYLMAYYFMGNVYVDRWQAGDFERAMEKYQALWKLAPNYVQSHHQAGLVYLKKAADDRRRFDELRAQGKTREAAAALEQLRVDWKEALRYFSDYHAIDPVFGANFARAAWVHMQIAELDRLTGHPTDAELHLDAAEAQYREAVEAWGCRKPEHDMMNENYEQTHRHYERIFAADEMFENLGNTRFIRGRLQEAVKAYRSSLWINPTNVRVLKNLASVYGRLGRQQDVIALWTKARQIAPQDPDVQRVFSHAPPSAPHP